MPELPEVETTKNELKSILLKNCIDRILINTKSLRIPLKIRKIKKLEDSRVVKVSRRGKYILIFFNNNHILIIHLGMSGRLSLKKNSYIVNKHDHIILQIKNKFNIVLNDPRKFGLVDVIQKKNLLINNYLNHLGIEPLSKDFSPKYLESILIDRRSVIKNLLLNQKLIAGLGNIYTCECLYESRISPFMIADSLKKEEIFNLCKNIKKILKIAIDSKGSSINDFKSPLGILGKFQNKFKVYNREGKICKNKFCKEKITRVHINGRSTYYCKNCQKK